jgi:hypothetical protein
MGKTPVFGMIDGVVLSPWQTSFLIFMQLVMNKVALLSI